MLLRVYLRPLCPLDIRNFVALDGYYRGFFEGFYLIASLLTASIKNKVNFVWSEACEKSYQELEGILCLYSNV